MCDNSLIEDLERYRRNNVELAVALNELKTELHITQMQLLERNRELQKVFDENATLKQNIVQKDSQLSTWRALIVDLVTTNTKKYTEMMQKIGLVPTPNGVTNKTIKIDNNTTSTKVAPVKQENVRTNVQRRQRQDDDDSPTRLPDLTEESIRSQHNESRSLTSSPELNPNHVTSRRRVSVPPMTEASSPPLRVLQERLVGCGESKGKKSSANVKKMEKIIDENTHTNVINGNGRKSQRRAAPKSLAEPKLGTKLRRN